MATRSPVIPAPSTTKVSAPDLLAEIRQRLQRQDADLEAMLARWKACEAEKVSNPDELSRARLARESQALEGQILTARIALDDIRRELETAKRTRAEELKAKWRPPVQAAVAELYIKLDAAGLAQDEVLKVLTAARAELGPGYEAWGHECAWREFVDQGGGQSLLDYRREWLRQNLWL